MILPSRRRRFWLGVGLVLVVVLCGSYVPYARRSAIPHGGLPMGLVYGGFATLLILILLYLAIRKRSYKSTWGTVDGWLQAHVYLGLVSVVAVALHSGFRFHDLLATATGWVLVLVVVTGLWGAALYSSLPRRLTQVQGRLTVAEVSDQLNQTARAMHRLTSGRSPAFQRVGTEALARIQPPRFAGWRLLLGPGTDDDEGRQAYWSASLEQVGEDERHALRQLLVLLRQHRELHLRLRFEQRYKNLLELWLYLHVPLSILLLVLVAIHVAGVVYYGAI